MPARSHLSATGNLLPLAWGSHQTPPGRKAAAIANAGWYDFCYHWGMRTQVIGEGGKRRPAGDQHTTKGHPAWFFTSSARQPCPWLLPSCCYNAKGKKNMSAWKWWGSVATLPFWLLDKVSSASHMLGTPAIDHIMRKILLILWKKIPPRALCGKDRICMPGRDGHFQTPGLWG